MSSTRKRWWLRCSLLSLGLGLGLGAVTACPLELERGRSCGDGWWDPKYEDCDPMDPDQPYIDRCRDQGFNQDAQCDPVSCEILDEPEDCNRCGDGIALDGEQCDGEDLRGESCAGGGGSLGCSSDCTYDYSGCPSFCGDDIISSGEECEPAVLCSDDEDCSDNRLCFEGNCIEDPGDFAPYNACANYETKAIGFSKPYASGTVDTCVDNGCFFGRNNCSFCGDGELDPGYDDFVAPSGVPAFFPAEVCDGEDVSEAALAAHCEPLCIDDAINSDVVVHCDFECSSDCQGFATPGDVVPPNPESLGCCLAKGSPCPNFEAEGVPNDLPCCSWLEKPEWAESQKCVVQMTGQIPVTQVCP